MNEFQSRVAMRMLDIIERLTLDRKPEAVSDGFTTTKVPAPQEEETFLDASIDDQLSDFMDSMVTAKE